MLDHPMLDRADAPPASAAPASTGMPPARIPQASALPTPTDAEYQHILQLAMRVFEVRFALISLWNGGHQLIAATIGLTPVQARRAGVLFARIMASSDNIVVCDARDDPRVASNPLIHSEPHIRLCAGAPLVLPSGQRIGNLCLLDRRARIGWSERERGMLVSMAGLVLERIQMSISQAERIAAQHADAARWREHEARLHRLAHFDTLTGLSNRNAFTQALQQALDQARGTSTTVAVVVLDLDDFKIVNDTLGHDAGDAVLREAAQRLQSALPAGANAARFGSDEFALVLRGDADPDLIAQTVEHLLDAVTGRYDYAGDVIHLEASAGLSFSSGAPDEAADLVAFADLALYQAKSAGGRSCRRFTPEMQADAHARRQLDLELRRALADDEFELYYQPQMDLINGKLIGAEALLRWRHPQRGLVQPMDFIDALARSPIAARVGSWILHEACAEAVTWRSHGGQPLRIGVNLFPVQVSNGELLEDVDSALLRSGLAAHQLELEITENIALQYDGDTGVALAELRRRGVRLAFDDFGTGYASLSILQRLPVDRIKIDRSFINDILSRHGDAAIVRSIVMISRNLDLRVIAEGVETAEQASMLRAIGCHEAQGYRYGRPMPADDFTDFVRTGGALDLIELDAASMAQA